MLEEILLQQFILYPKMDPQDAVKLIYQQEFGPEHMIANEKKALAQLKQEMAALGPVMDGEALYESIGNGLCRLNLRPCLRRGVPAEDICRMFVETAQSAKGDKKRFWQGIRVLQKLAEEDETPFEPVLLDIFLAKYPKSCPAVHHSDTYRLAYRPAYRVVNQRKLKDYLKALRG